MKQAASGLAQFLAAQRAAPDSVMGVAECFTLTLQSGLVVRSTSADVDIVYAGAVFPASGLLVEGLKYRCTIGLNPDQQDLTISANPADLLDGAAIMAMIADGAFDGCALQRDRVFFADRIGGALVGGVTLFKGRIIEVSECGRLSAKISVASDLVALAIDMPRNVYMATCNNVLYDNNCGIPEAACTSAGAVGAGSSARTILSAAALEAHVGGVLTFTSGVNAGVSATVKNVKPGVSFTLMFPAPRAPGAGDAFEVCQGCDHTMATCAARFNNLGNFRGFPFVPPPQYAQ